MVKKLGAARVCGWGVTTLLALSLAGFLGAAPAAEAVDWTADVNLAPDNPTTTTVNSPVTPAGSVTVGTNATLDISSGGSIGMITPGKNFTIAGGTVNIKGTYAGVSNYGGGNNPYTTGSSFNLNSGTLVVGDSSNGPALVEFETVNFTGGTATISSNTRDSSGNVAPDNTHDGAWRTGSDVFGRVINVSGTEITLGNNGMLATSMPVAGASSPKNSINITGGKIIMSGISNKESILWGIAAMGTADLAASTANNRHSAINLSGGEINATGEGAIVTREFNLNSGDLKVGGSGKLTFGGIAADMTASADTDNDGNIDVAIAMNGKTVIQGIALGSSELTLNEHNFVKQWGHVNIKGGKITNEGKIDFVTGKMTLNATGGELTGKLNIQNSFVDTAANATATNLTVTGGTFTVGKLALGTGGTVTVNSNGKLVVSDTTASSISAAGGSLAIGDTGTVTARLEDFRTDFTVASGGATTIGSTTNTALRTALSVADGGKLYLRYDGGQTGGSLTAANVATIASDLGITGAGKLSFLGLNVEGQDEAIADATSGSSTVSTGLDNSGAESTITITATDTTAVTSVAFSNTMEVGTLDLVGGDGTTISDAVAVTFNSDVVLAGNDGALIKVDGEAKPVNVTAKGDVTLGIAGNTATTQGGELGDVTLSSLSAAATVEVNDGVFTVGTISGGSESQDVAVAVATSSNSPVTTSLEAAAITLGSVNAGKTTEITVTKATLDVAGAITLNTNANSGITLENATVEAASIAGGSKITVESSDLAVAGDIVLADSNTSKVEINDGSIVANKLDLGTGTNNMITVGSKASAGTLKVNELALRGGTLFLDPAFVPNRNGGYDIERASAAFIELFTNDKTDGHIIVGQNSHLTYGANNTTWLAERIEEVGAWGPNSISAAIGIAKPLTIGANYSLTVNGAITEGTGSNDGQPVTGSNTKFNPTANTANFAENSLLVIDASKLNGKAALTAEGSGKATIADSAKLYVYNTKNANAVQVLAGFTNSVTGSWASENIMNDSPMLTTTAGATTGGISTVTAVNDANQVYGNIGSGTASFLNEFYGARLNTIGSENAGVDFVSKATSRLNNGDNLNSHIATIEGATGISAVGGSQFQAVSIGRLNASAIRERFAFKTGEGNGYASAGFASDSALASSAVNGGGLSVWATPLYQHTRMSGMPTGAFENKIRSNMGGVTLGADYTAGDNLRFGVAGHFGGGQNKTNDSVFASTTNKFDYAGVSGFIGWSMCNWSVLLDGGFLRTSNELSQANRFGGSINADANVHSWNAGLTVERKFSTVGGFDIVPHVGIRYEGINTRDHDVSSAAGRMFNVDSDTQHLLTAPVGVRFGKSFVAGCWTVAPYVDAGVVVTTGDRNYAGRYSIPNVTGSHSNKARIVDSVAFDGKLGVQVERGQLFGGVGYNVLRSKNASSHSLSATVGFTF